MFYIASMSLRSLAGLLACIVLSAPASGQDWAGLSVSSFGGMHAALANPAMLGTMRHRLQVGTLATNAQLSTNMLTYTGPSGLRNLFTPYMLTGNAYDYLRGSNLSEGLQSIFDGGRWQRIRSGDPKDFSATAELRGPFLAGTIGGLGVGMGYRLRGGLQLANVSASVADLFFSGTTGVDPLVLGAALRDSKFSASANAYHEFYGTVAFPALKLGRHYLGGGITLKYLAGIYSAGVINRGLSYKILGPDSLLTTEADISYQYVNNNLLADDPTAARGNGAGVDIGAIYEYRGLNDDDQPYGPGKGRHVLRAGLSVVDAGRISYDGQGIRAFDFKRRDSLNIWGSIDTLRVRGTASLDSVFNQVFGAANSRQSFNTGLPAMVNVFVDVRLFKFIYLTAKTSQSLIAIDRGGLRAFSGLTLMPRLETRLFEVAIPMGIGLGYSYFQPGFFARISGFFVGSDNLSTLFGVGNRAGMSFYAGGFVPIRR